ncbi:MAG: hypothetical protein R2822_02110 [Spirosomataceae bacterium]
MEAVFTYFPSSFQYLAQISVYKVEGKLGNVDPTDIAYVRYFFENKGYRFRPGPKMGGLLLQALLINPTTHGYLMGKSVRFYLESGNISVVSPTSKCSSGIAYE